MADTTAAGTTNAAPAEESQAQKAARLRREKRNAKILNGGSDRLNKITSLSGRPAPMEEDVTIKRSSSPSLASQPTPSQSAFNNHSSHDDPAEVDISQMFQRPPADFNAQDPQALFRQMLMGAGPQEQGAPGAMDGQNPDEDPMMRMMQQMMSGLGGGEGGAGGGLPPGLASMFGGQQQPEPDTFGSNIWRIVHAAFSLLLGIYATMTFTFTGSKAGRNQFAVESAAPQLFWVFATVELMLQSGRYFLDGGKLPSSGILGGIGQMLPEPYANYVRIFSRYSIIYTTVVSDAMVVLFVLGLVAWWKGLAAS